ncbi:hypothetical protein GCM10009789_41510 [Kribbella sancticallisti]|uniref:Uncharacterized protein n=1 Tax=Kribbella sancticallisti TaxID=460087 RepID=A0ABN2DT55_9ACTN
MISGAGFGDDVAGGKKCVLLRKLGTHLPHRLNLPHCLDLLRRLRDHHAGDVAAPRTVVPQAVQSQAGRSRDLIG